MFIDSDATNRTPTTSPWFIGASKWRARYYWRLMTKISHKDVYRHMNFVSVPLMFLLIMFFVITVNAPEGADTTRLIIPIVFLLPVAVFQIWRVIMHDRVNRHQRKYCAQPGDYSYDALFRRTTLVATDEELQSVPELRRLVDVYFDLTRVADETIRRSRLEHHGTKEDVDYLAQGTRQDIVEVVSKVRHQKSMNM